MTISCNEASPPAAGMAADEEPQKAQVDSSLRPEANKAVNSKPTRSASANKARGKAKPHESPEAKVANVPSPAFEVLKDMSTIKVEPGSASPKIGDRIYTMATLPQDECGEFWVKTSDGYVARIAVCTGDHEGGH